VSCSGGGGGGVGGGGKLELQKRGDDDGWGFEVFSYRYRIVSVRLSYKVGNDPFCGFSTFGTVDRLAYSTILLEDNPSPARFFYFYKSYVHCSYGTRNEMHLIDMAKT